MALAALERAAAAKGEGCLGKAHDGEPVFVLRAHDKFMPMLVELWAEMVETVAEVSGSKAKVTEARILARQARNWQAFNGCKVPD
jgi:hypothetical protein